MEPSRKKKVTAAVQKKRQFTHHLTQDGKSYFVPKVGEGGAVWELPEDAELANLGVG